jgi:CRISPR-associated exonuclease Cas4
MNITGIMVYYYFICEQRLWYFANQINMEQNSELVQIGKIIDETTYKREKKGILIDNTIKLVYNSKLDKETKIFSYVSKLSIFFENYIIYINNKVFK